MRYLFLNIPATEGNTFEKNFHAQFSNIDGEEHILFCAGHSWSYPTKIRGWRDWDFPQQEPGIFRNVGVIGVRTEDTIVTIVKNPFLLLFDYYKNDWADCRTYQNISSDGLTKKDFRHFVDMYLDDESQFHAPAFKKSMFSQLKDEDGNWLNNEFIIIRHEQLHKDIQKFVDKFHFSIKVPFKKDEEVENWESFYTDTQIEKLKELWKDDLDRFSYEAPKLKNKSLDIIPNLSLIPKSGKKIAICFSGHVRDVAINSQYWKSIIDKYDIDVYGSFWDEQNVELGDTIDNFKKLYNSKIVEIESFKAFEKSTLSLIRTTLTPPNDIMEYLQNSTKSFGTLPMWYKVWKANMLTKILDIEYDLVIRARTDSHFKDDFELELNNMLNIPIGMNKTHKWPDSYGFNDIFAYGTPKIMDYYSLCYLFMMEHIGKGYYMVPPEYFLHTHMNKVSVDVRLIPNHIVITRTSKGKKDEVYNGWVSDLKENIIKSDFMDIVPNKNVKWSIPFKDSLKF